MRRRFKKRWGLPKGFPVLDDKIRLSEILKLLTLILMSDEKFPFSYVFMLVTNHRGMHI